MSESQRERSNGSKRTRKHGVANFKALGIHREWSSGISDERGTGPTTARLKEPMTALMASHPWSKIMPRAFDVPVRRACPHNNRNNEQKEPAVAYRCTS
jgi:hypothetical protein